MLDIHQSCKARLIERLENIINSGQIDTEDFLYDDDTFSELFYMDRSLPDTRDLKIMLEKYIGDGPLFHFCLYTIKDIVREQEAYNKDRATYPLIEVPYFQNAREAAERIINDFISLPKEYVAIIRFGKELSVSFESVCPRALRNYGEYFRSIVRQKFIGLSQGCPWATPVHISMWSRGS